MSKSIVKLAALLLLSTVLGVNARAEEGVAFAGGGTLPLGGSEATFHGDGTLPLRLGGSDGTLPLILSGAATTGGTAELSTSVTITQATTQAFQDPAGTLLRCQTSGADVSKHWAAGTVAVNGATYEIKGICYTDGSRLMEIVAERAGSTEQSFMASILGADQPKQLSDSLTLIGPSPRSGRFTFNVKSPNG